MADKGIGALPRRKVYARMIACGAWALDVQAFTDPTCRAAADGRAFLAGLPLDSGERPLGVGDTHYRVEG